MTVGSPQWKKQQIAVKKQQIEKLTKKIPEITNQILQFSPSRRRGINGGGMKKNWYKIACFNTPLK